MCFTGGIVVRRVFQLARFLRNWVLRCLWRAWTIAHRHPSPGLSSIYCSFEIGARSITTLDHDLFPSVLMHVHVLGHIRVSHCHIGYVCCSLHCNTTMQCA